MFGSVGEARPLVRDVLLRDGSTLRLQTATAADFDDVREFFDSLSPESRLMRFHGNARSEIAARAVVGAGGADRVVLIARHDHRVVAVAGFEGLREPRAATVTFAVADDFQGRGAATRMLEQLAEIAAHRGITRFDAEVQSDNRAMLAVFEHVGFAVRRRAWFGEMTVSLDIAPSEAVRTRIDERDHVAAVTSLRPLLAPSSIAVAGAASTPGNVGRAVLANIVAGDFQGVVRPVNRAGGVVCSRQAATSLGELDFVPELVIIAADGDEVIEFAAEAAARGAKALMVLPASLHEHLVASIAPSERLLEIVRGSGMRMVGPRGLGIINTAADVSLNATLSGARVRAGALAIGAQAVAPGLGLLGHVEARQMGISTLISVGGRMDVSTNDMLEWCDEDDRTAVVVLYVESFSNPERFTRVAQRLSRRKPILVIKGRRSAERARGQARSDTVAALRGDAIVDAVLQQAGVLRFDSSEELFHVAQLFESQPLPLGRRIGIISNSASIATLAADACATRGLEVQDSRGAPYPVVLGLGAGAPEYSAEAVEFLAGAGVDALLVCYVDHLEGDPEGVLDAICELSSRHSKPVVASIVRSDGRLAVSSVSPSVPNYTFPESCVAVLARAAGRRAWLSRPLGVHPDYPDLDLSAARDVIAAALEREPGGGWLTPADAEALLLSHGIPVADPPVGADALVGAGALAGADVLVGTFTDPDLGPVIAVGLGGGQAGLGEGIACRRPPTTDIEADELIDACRGVAIQLDGFRGAGPLDRNSLRELILRFALLLDGVPEVVEADLNPVRCSADSSFVAGMRMRIEPRRPLTRVKTW
jgi:acetate---CoA ligase (ADP-forming)